MYAEAFHRGKRTRDGPIAHDPHEHVHRFWRERDEVVERVVSRGGLWDFVVRFRLYRMNQVGEFNRILDEEDRDVVANQVPIAF